jgi:hypothetical protein
LLLALDHLVDFLSQWYLCPLWHLPIMPASNKSQPLEVNLAVMTMQRSAADQSIQNLQVQVGKPVTQNEHPIWNTWFSAKVGWPSTKPCFDQTVPTSKLFRKPMLASQGYYHGQQSKLTGFLIQVVISWLLPWIQQIPYWAIEDHLCWILSLRHCIPLVPTINPGQTRSNLLQNVWAIYLPKSFIPPWATQIMLPPPSNSCLYTYTPTEGLRCFLQG